MHKLSCIVYQVILYVVIFHDAECKYQDTVRCCCVPRLCSSVDVVTILSNPGSSRGIHCRGNLCFSHTCGMRRRRGWDYPLHLGVTEAGEGEDGRMKSAIGIGALLMDGLGDTIRVSLTEDPEFELNPCSNLAEVRCRNSHVVHGGISGPYFQALVVSTTTMVQNRRTFAVF